MAIPVGTTSRQVQWLARWSLGAAMILGMMSWWWPGYRSWGSVLASIALVLSLWLAARILSADRSVPGHPVHFVLLIPAAILAVHFARHVLEAGHASHLVLDGSLDLSMIYWLCSLGLGVMLTQSLLPRAAMHTVVLGLAGAAMMLGPAAAILAGPTAPIRTALALLGFAGVAVWLTMLWGLGGGSDKAGASGPRQPYGPGRLACLAVAVAAALALSLEAPLQALLVAGIVATVLFAAGLIFPARRVVFLLAGGLLAVAVVAVLSLVDWVRSALMELLVQSSGASVLGQGEQAFRHVSAGDAGLTVLVGMVGWAGAAWFVGGLALCVVWMLLHARRGHAGDRGRAIVWSVAAGCVSAALIAPGGLFVPATALAASFVLGMLPVMLGRPRRDRSGLLLLAAIGAMLVLLGLAPSTGLFTWSLGHFGKSDTVIHIAIGFLAAMLLAWQMGTRRIWLGLAGIGIGAMLGGPAELMQLLFSERSAELRDWLHHAMGAGCAVVPYLLCMFSRWCESPDARGARTTLAYEAYLR